MIVFPKAIVPRLIVTDSRIDTLLPINVCVSSPEYIEPCGFPWSALDFWKPDFWKIFQTNFSANWSKPRNSGVVGELVTPQMPTAPSDPGLLNFSKKTKNQFTIIIKYE